MSHPADVDISPLEGRIAELVNGGGSGRGNSFYAGAAECGRRARLAEQKRAAFAHIDAPVPLSRNKMAVGGVYHALHQLWRLGEMPDLDDPILDAMTLNENIADALRLFRGWARFHEIDFWGDTLAVEEQLPSTQKAKTAISSHFQGLEYTGKVDMVVRIASHDLPRIQRRLPDLRTPGVYLLDWKTRSSHGTADAYTNGLQALTYPALYNIEHPGDPCIGLIWDIVVKNDRRKVQKPVVRDDFDACFVSTVLTHRDPGDALSEVAGMVMQGDANYSQSLPNRAACSSWTGEQCTFKTSGQCDARMQT